MKIELSGKVVLVSGASRGIGRAAAELLGASGARVAVHYVRSRAAAEQVCERIEKEGATGASNREEDAWEDKARAVQPINGLRAKPFQADLENPEEVSRLFEEVLAEFGQVDVLVNNAGIAEAAPLDQEMEDWLQGWDRTQAVNLRASAQLSRLCVAHWRARKSAGRLIHIASRAAFRGDTPDYLAYAASKAGMVAMSRSLARGLGKEGITSFVIAPGFVQTDMAQPFLDAYGEDYATFDIALEKLTQPEDVAPTVCLLASGLADHATGTVIDINAGSYVR